MVINAAAVIWLTVGAPNWHYLTPSVI